MDKKLCTGCNHKKPLDQFSSRGNGKHHSRCKQCQRDYCKEHYQRNRDLHINRAKLRKKETRSEQSAKIASIKSESSCADCRKRYPFYVMDFDHVRGDKISNISDMMGCFGWDAIEQEIAKCDIVCANCHRERTWKRQQDMV